MPKLEGEAAKQIILYPEQLFEPGRYESPIIDIPFPCNHIQVSATRINWIGDDTLLELYIFDNYHPKMKWNMLIGFKACGTTRKPEPVSSVKRRIKSGDYGQVKISFQVFQQITTEISLEFT